MTLLLRQLDTLNAVIPRLDYGIHKELDALIKSEQGAELQ